MEASVSVSAVAASWVMAMSNGSGLRSTRLRISAPSTLLHTLVANPVAREAGTVLFGETGGQCGDQVLERHGGSRR